MNHGFSLLELSIVLVIIGLLAGGVMVGQDLVRQAELRNYTTQTAGFKTAINAFKNKYSALPGDMRNAVRYWGAQAGGNADGHDTTCRALGFTSPATDTRTCNGDGNGQIGWLEAWRAWQHLSNAGLLEGTYSGVPGSTTDSSVGTPGFNMPVSKTNSSIGFVFYWNGVISAPSSAFPGTYNHVFRLGAGNGVDQGTPLRARDVYQIEIKIDDGRPGTGILRVYTQSARGNCATTDDPATAEYQLTNMGSGCNTVEITGF
jgi:prepilin-type N-terminal cleavage/methylation domain-containing protein